MTKPRHRLHRFFKWVTLGSCVVVVAAWVASLFVSVAYQAKAGDVGFSGKGFHATIWNVGVSNPGWNAFPPSPQSWSLTLASPVGVGLSLHRLYVPFWMALILVTAVTILVWRYDPRPPPGHCQYCGYNLTGNVSGRCPECGKAT